MALPNQKTRAESMISVKLNKSIMSLSLLSLDKFCSKKLYSIAYVTPLTVHDYDFLNQIISTSKNFEHLSGVHFVTYQDVLEFVTRLAGSRANVQLPDFLQESLENAFEYESTRTAGCDSIPTDILSLMMKMKIIETMYTTYSSEVSTMQRRRELHEELASLLKEPEAPDKHGKKGKGKDKKTGKKEKKSKDKDKGSKKKGKAKGASSTTVIKEKSKPSKVEVGDYTEITLQENEVIFDYNIDNHAQYIILSGFPDPEIFSELSKIEVTVSAIIEISQQSSNAEDLTRFVVNLHNLFDTPKMSRFFENTALMKHHSSKDGHSWKENFEQLLYVVRKINYIKRQHLSYLRNLEVHHFGGVPKKIDLDCLQKYNRIMNEYPAELTNVAVIIDALIEEVCWRDLGPIYSLSDLSVSSTETDLDDGVKYPENIPFQVHEEDCLNLSLHCYKEIGRKYYDKTLEYLKLLKPLEEFVDYSPVKSRDRTVSTEDDCYCTDIKSYLDFFHLAIFSQLKQHTPFEAKPPEEYDFTSNLVTFDDTRILQKALPRKTGPILRTPITGEENDIISNYHLKEDLSTSVLRQLIFKAFMQYSCYDRAYCEESGAVLLRFHDNLDEFGIATKIWNQSLRTPVCLRDFCRHIAADERKWLEEHRLKEHAEFNEDEVEEECDGLRDMHVPQLYQEYQYLLENPSGVTTEEKKRAFDEVLDEILKYPRSDLLTSYCGMPDDENYFTAYNLGASRVQLTGHTTIFRSDDGVKVTIDASRFLTENPKCSLKIDADDNSLVFHTVDPSAFHVVLKDETLVRFSKLNPTAETFNQDVARTVEAEEENATTPSKEDEILEREEGTKPEIPNTDNHWVQMLRKHKVPGIFPDFFSKINVADRKIHLDGHKLDALLEVFKTAVYLNHPIYKISTKPSPHRLERTKSSLTMPLVYLLKRILFKPPRKKKKIRGYSVVFATDSTEKEPQTYNFTINLPHGLIITTLPRTKDLVEVKQSYQYCKTDEDYRIFYTTGVILIRNSDGSTTIYRSNGDIIELTDQSETHSVNCPKNMTKIFGKTEQEECPYKLSRCDSPVVKDDRDFIALYEFGDIPYNKKTLLEFGGKKTTVFGGKVTETQEYYVLNENDYPAEEKFFEREDGLRCVIDRKGKRTIEFPDGSKIIASPKMEKELISVSKNPKVAGWVSVIINYKFEHPKYVPVVYDAFEKSTQIFLKDGMIKNNKDSFTMTMPQNVAVEVTADNIVFLKTCPQCNGDCICKIDVKNSGSNKLLEVCDSYNKYFVCDHEGYCEINTKFIKRALNKNKCDHRWVDEDKNLFILNSRNDPPGTILWKDGIVEKKIDETKNRKNVKFSNYVSKLTKKQTIEFFTEIYQNFTGRFTMTQSYQNKICLSKHKHLNLANRLFYVTFRIMTEFQNIEDDLQMLDELKILLRDNLEIAPDLFEAMKKMLTYVLNHEKVEDEERCSYRLTIQESQETLQSSASSKSEDLDKITVQQIISKWRNCCDEQRYLIRNRIFPGYFHSDYYRNIMSALNAK